MRRSMLLLCTGAVLVPISAAAQTPLPLKETAAGAKADSGNSLDALNSRSSSHWNTLNWTLPDCDVDAFERELAALQRLYQEAKRIAELASIAGEFSTVEPAQAKSVRDRIKRQIEWATWKLLYFKKACAKRQPMSAPEDTQPQPTTGPQVAPTSAQPAEDAEPKTDAEDEPRTPDRVETLREELEAGRQRQAERRREARQQLKPDEQTLLDLHNRARSQVGSPPLEWDRQLAAQAASYGPALAQHGRPVHSPREGRETSRENLLQALPGTSAEKMIAVWTAERQHFVPGIFPDVSSTGNWADVGHYTQMVWPATTSVGCAIHRGGQFDWLICRYSPPGNQDGKPVLSASPVPRARE